MSCAWREVATNAASLSIRDVVVAEVAGCLAVGRADAKGLAVASSVLDG